MAFFELLFAGGMIYLLYRFVASWFLRRPPSERSFMFRTLLIGVLLAFVLLVAFLFAPNKARLLLLLPALLGISAVAKLWRDGRARLRRNAERDDAFERMKRVN